MTGMQSRWHTDILTMRDLEGNAHDRASECAGIVAQMGDQEQIDASEVWRITMQPLHGLYMHCQPRVPAQSNVVAM